jgi:putative FmdB family regulatory protein
MPIFEYACSNCGHKFEKLILSASRERQLQCPECSSRDIQKMISLFGTAGGGSSQASAANCAPSG